MCEENYEDIIYESEKFINIENVDDIKEEVIKFFIQLGKYFENDQNEAFKNLSDENKINIFDVLNVIYPNLKKLFDNVNNITVALYQYLSEEGITNFENLRSCKLEIINLSESK
ncbi:hypothetical protein [Staphylococcus warneri]|uniref:hypothetical protein n=1 Tax=Staphylococcus warneri TaxID=1292 RepID=UPI0025575C8B|nr:hypothetical protein [Staphylococcus warneri]MDK8170804.1 hypothetical protein [Staphylococcus warneri]